MEGHRNGRKTNRNGKTNVIESGVNDRSLQHEFHTIVQEANSGDTSQQC